MRAVNNRSSTRGYARNEPAFSAFRMESPANLERFSSPCKGDDGIQREADTMGGLPRQVSIRLRAQTTLSERSGIRKPLFLYNIR